MTDTDGESEVAITTVEVTNVPPTISLAGDSSVNEDTTYELTLGEITDPGQDTVTQWIVNWGDGSKQTFTSGGPKTHVYVEGDVMPTITVDLVDEDGTHESAGARTVTVVAVNRVPTADAQSVSTPEDTVKAIALTASDHDGDNLTFAVIDSPEHGTLAGELPNVTYSPIDDYHGPDQFTFKVNDGELDSEIATIDITVSPLNDVPVAAPQLVTTDEDNERDIVLAGSDLDGDSLTFSLGSLPEHGTLTGAIPDLTYSPATNFVGNDEFTFNVSDGTAISDPATISVTVRAVNDPPSVNDLEDVTDEDTPIDLPLGFDDVDGDALIIGVLSMDTLGDVEIIDEGSWTLRYDPTQSQAIQQMVQGDSLDESISLSISDGNGAVETATATVTVLGITDWQNPGDQLDSNGDGEVSPIDALVIINTLNEDGSRQLPSLLEPARLWYDVNGDGSVSPIDPLVIINHLNEPEAGGEGHFVAVVLLKPTVARERASEWRIEDPARSRTHVDPTPRVAFPVYHDGPTRRKTANLEALDGLFALLDDHLHS